MKIIEQEAVKVKSRAESDNHFEHPLESWLRMDRMPHIWCLSCGIGTAVTCFVEAVKKTNINRDDIAVVSGIGCSGLDLMKFIMTRP